MGTHDLVTAATGKTLSALFPSLSTNKDSHISEFSLRIQGKLPATDMDQAKDYS